MKNVINLLKDRDRFLEIREKSKVLEVDLRGLQLKVSSLNQNPKRRYTPKKKTSKFKINPQRYKKYLLFRDLLPK